MTKNSKKVEEPTEVREVIQVTRGVVTLNLRGVTPLIIRRMSQKGVRELLFPSGRKTAGQKKTTLKHDPVAEFRESPYTSSNPKDPTLLLMPSMCFKNAMASVAVDLPGDVKKAQIMRSAFVEGDYVPVWGIPKLRMDIVRSADMNRTPDVRTRACLTRWATTIKVQYAVPILSASVITGLIGNAGIMQGVGDFRVQKGKGQYGTWTVCAPDDPEFLSIMREGRKAQEEAMRNPQPYDEEAADLLGWFQEELEKRRGGFTGAEEVPEGVPEEIAADDE